MFFPSKKGLYNQLLPQFLSNQSENLHNCYRYTWDVHLLSWKKNIIFDKITAFTNLEIFEFWLIQEDNFI